MKCSKCGAEIPDGSRFCDKCGAAQNAFGNTQQNSQAASQQNAAGAAKSGGSGGLIKTILLVALVFFVARMAGQWFGSSIGQSSGSAAQQPASTSNTVLSTIAPLKDIIERHDVVSCDLGDGLTSYVAVYYGNDTRVMTKLLSIVRLDTSYGYSRENVDNAEYRSQFPSFAQFSYYEEDGAILCVIHMDDLKNDRRMREMVEKEIILLEEGESLEDSGGFLAHPFLQSLYDEGYKDVPLVEYGSLHLD